MERRIRDSAGQEYLIVDAPPDAPGLGVGAFSDERTAELFLRRFVNAPLAMAALRELLLDEGLPAHRLDPGTMVSHLAGRLVKRGMRLVDPAGHGGGPGPSGPSGGSGASAAAAEATEEEGAEVAAATKKKPEKKKTLTARWSPLEAYCADKVKLLGTGTNHGANTYCSGIGTTALGGKVASRSCEGQTSFTCEWPVSDVVFSGAEAPAKQDVAGQMAGGIVAKCPQPLAVKRVPDQPLKPVQFRCSSGKYGWAAGFKVGIKNGTIQVDQTLKISPGWLGKWIEFDLEADGKEGTTFIKKDVTQWVCWDFTAVAWVPLPRAVSEYEINNMVFVESGSRFESRSQPGVYWPEPFVANPNLQSETTAWLAEIHQIWDDKFYLKHKDCKSGNDACCRWRLRFTVRWTQAEGDLQIYAVSAPDWERSDCVDWYLSENRQGVAAHECGHLLGAFDEYAEGAVDPATNIVDDSSIMGNDLTVALSRHLDNVRDEVGKIINAAIGRSWTFEVK